MIPHNEADIQSFFAMLYPDAHDGWLVLSHPDPDPTHVNPKTGKRWLLSEWLNLAQTSLARAAEIAATLSQQDTVYFGVCLQRPDCQPAPYHRSTNAGAYVVPGLWFDLDLAYGQHAASTLPQTDAEALDFLATLPAAPSLIVHSGGGLYPFWLFKEPYVVTTDAERETLAQLSKRFTQTLVVAGQARGWTLDALGDLSRVLRPAGSRNFKYDKPVEVIHTSGLRYNPSEFDWLVDLPGPVHTTHGGAAIPGQPDLVAIAEHYGTALERKSQTELAGAHPQHGSSTGDNFNLSVAKGLWHCWRHGTGGDSLSLIAVCEDLIACEDMRPGALRGDTFRRVVNIANATFQAGIQLDAEKRRNGDAPGLGREPPLPLSDYTNALAFVRDHGQGLRYCYPWKAWLVWTGTHWQRDTSGEVMRLAKQTVKRLARGVEAMDDEEAIDALMRHIKSSLSTTKLKALVENAQSEPGIAVQPQDLDTDPWLLNCANGTLNLKTGALCAHQRQDLMTKCLPLAYDPEARCPQWIAFLETAMDASTDAQRSAELIVFLQQALGYSLTGSTCEQCFFIIHGVTKTGKSTFINIAKRLLGPYATQAEMSTFLYKDRETVRNDLADLAGMRLVCAIETDKDKRLAEALIKQLTGGTDSIKARFLFEEYFEYRPQFKVFLATNHLPKITGDDDAIWERVHPIPFAVHIPKDARDKHLEAKLVKELPGILAWAVRGCRTWQQNDGLAVPPAVDQSRDQYRDEMDTLADFLNDCCIAGNPNYVKVQATHLAGAYHQWCKRTSTRPYTNRALIAALEAKGYTRDRGHANQYYWSGVSLVDTETSPYETREKDGA